MSKKTSPAGKRTSTSPRATKASCLDLDLIEDQAAVRFRQIEQDNPGTDPKDLLAKMFPD